MKRLIPLLLLLEACSPAKISRIGPTLPPRRADCDIEVLEPGRTPDRPYRDVGMVSLENCQDYEQRPCLDWLTKAACELGGDIAYLPEDQPPKSEMGPVTYRVMVAAYLVGLRPTDQGPSGGDCETGIEEDAADMGRCTE